MPFNQLRLDGYFAVRKPLPKHKTYNPIATKKTLGAKKTGDSHLYESHQGIKCGFYVLLGVMNGSTKDMDNNVAVSVCSREALRVKKKHTKAEAKLLAFCTSSVGKQDADTRPTVIKGPGRGKGMWIRHGTLHPTAFEEGNIRGLWTMIFGDVIHAYSKEYTVVVLTLEVWKAHKQGKPVLIGWRKAKDGSTIPPNNEDSDLEEGKY